MSQVGSQSTDPKALDTATYSLEVVPFESSLKHVAFDMRELALSFHLAVFKLTLVSVALHPFENPEALDLVVFKRALERCAVCKDSVALAVLAVAVPGPFVLCKHALV